MEHANYFLICAYTLCVALEAWTSNAINVVLVDIAGNTRASADEASWIITIYSAGAAISIVTSHAICRVIGERLYILACALLFCFSSAGCALSFSLPTLLACRALQGLAGGAFMSRTLVLLVTHFKSSIRTRPLRYYLLILFILGRVAAPLCGGFLADRFSWRSLFWVDVLGSLVATWFFCIAPRHEKLLPRPSRRNPRFDACGALLLILGVVGVQVVISRGEVDNWLDSPLIRFALIVGIAAHIGFALWQMSRTNAAPLVHLRHLWSSGLFAVVLLGVFLGTLFSAVVYAMPYYLRLTEDHSAFQTGYLMAIIGIPMVLFATQAPRFAQLVQRLGGRVVLQIGLSLQILSSALIVLFISEDTPDIYLVIPLALSGAFIFFTAVGLALAGFAGIAPRRISNARTLYFGARQLGNSLGISLGIILLDRREAFHSQRILENFFGRNRSALPNAPDAMQLAEAKSFGASVLTQAGVLSYQDFYVVIAVLASAAFICAWMLPGPRKTKAAQVQSQPDAAYTPLQTLEAGTK
ncbi:MAG: MFS transporter [Terracidiphilus sp.]|nr:MFS transporter [Terracidiphilus sp.]